MGSASHRCNHSGTAWSGIETERSCVTTGTGAQAAAPAVSVVVTDTHALIWYATGPQRKLGRRARAAFERAERGETIVHVPALVLVELAEAMRRGVLHADGGFTRWVEQLLASRHFAVADLTAAIVREAEGLYNIPERGDRLIAATAVHLGCPLLTNDPAITRSPTVATLW